MPFVPVVHNWQTPLRCSYEFRTVIGTSDNGKERRFAMRSTPRRSIELSVWPEHRRVIADYTLRQVSTVPFRIADPTAIDARLKEPAAASDAFVRVRTRRSWMRQGARVALVNARRVVEATIQFVTKTRPTPTFSYQLPLQLRRPVGVDSFPYEFPVDLAPLGEDTDGVYLVLGAATGSAWPVDAQVLSVVEGFFDTLQFSMVTDNQMLGTVRFSVLPAVAEIDTGEREDGVNGREVLAFRPDWSTQPTIEFPEVREFADFDRGRVTVYDPVPFQTRNAATFHSHRATEARRIIDFFHRAKGRRGEFHRPSWTSDLTLAEDIPAGSNLLRVEGPEIAVQFGDRTTYGAVSVTLDSGVVHTAGIYAMLAVSGQTVFNLDRGLPAIPRSRVAMVSWAPACRFATDELAVSWITRDWATMTISCTELYDEGPEEGASILDAGTMWLIATYGWDFVLQWMIDPMQRAVNVVYPRIVLGEDLPDIYLHADGANVRVDSSRITADTVFIIGARED